MDQPDERDAENVVLDKHRFPEVCTAAHEDRRDEVGNEWVREPDARVGWIFRREVVAECKTRDHAEVKRKIAEVVQKPGADTCLVLDDCAIEHLPENDGR